VKPKKDYTKPKLKRLLRVEGWNFVAGAVWARVKGVWFVAGPVAPILMWMHGLTPEQAVEGLKRRGCTWQWIDDPAISAGGLAGSLTRDESSAAADQFEWSELVENQSPTAPRQSFPPPS